MRDPTKYSLFLSLSLSHSLHMNAGAIELLAQMCLSAPAAHIYTAYKKVCEQLVPEAQGMSALSDARRKRLRQLIWHARLRAGDMCAKKGQVLLQDAALCYYWAERDMQECEDEPLNMQRYLATITSLLDLYAAPGRGGSRQTRAKVLDHCTELVNHMIAALETPPQPHQVSPSALITHPMLYTLYPTSSTPLTPIHTP